MSNDDLDRLAELERSATPGPWHADPKRLVVNGQQGPIMCYLAGDAAQPEGMKVSIASERLADHHFIATLRNAFPALLALARRAQEMEEPSEALASRLIDAWCADKGKQIPWAKAVQIIAIVTKQSDEERDRLLRMGDEDGTCGMCGRAAAPDAAPTKEKP